MKTRKKYLIGLAILWVVTLLLPLFTNAPRAKAVNCNFVACSQDDVNNATFKFINEATIQGTIGGKTVLFYDKNVSDNINPNTDNNTDPRYQPQVNNQFCDQNGDNVYIKINNMSAVVKGSDGKAEIKLTWLNYKTNKCNHVDLKNQTVSNSDGAASIMFIWNNGDITDVNSKVKYKGSDSKDGVFYPQNSNYFSSCGSVIYVTGDNTGILYYLQTKPFNSGSTVFTPASSDKNLSPYFSDPSGNSKCGYEKVQDLPDGQKDQPNPLNIQIGGPKNTNNPAGVGGTGGNQQQNCVSNSSSCTGADSCVSLSSTTLEWILCPILNTISDAADAMANAIQNQLNFDVNGHFDDNSGAHAAWAAIKDIASIMLVILMLVMVFSQAAGGQMFDAYTVKKVLPKIVIAVIVMQLSWFLCKYAIKLADDAGNGIRDLLAAPFGGIDHLKFGSILGRLNPAYSIGTEIGIAGALIIILSTVEFSAFILPVLCLLAFMLFSAVVVALATILARNIIMILLVLTVPIALIMWVWPGQSLQKYWKQWADNFTKVLVLFPLIMLIIYGGRVAAYIIASNNGGSPGPIDYMMILVAFFGPLFMLPKVWKWGGGIMSAAARGIADNKAVSGTRKFGNTKLGEWVGRTSGLTKYNAQDPALKSGRFGEGQRLGRFTPGFLRGKRNPANMSGRIAQRFALGHPLIGSRYDEARAAAKYQKYKGEKDHLEEDFVKRQGESINEEGGMSRYMLDDSKVVGGEARTIRPSMYAKGKPGRVQGMKAAYARAVGSGVKRRAGMAWSLFVRSKSWPENGFILTPYDDDDHEYKAAKGMVDKYTPLRDKFLPGHGSLDGRSRDSLSPADQADYDKYHAMRKLTVDPENFFDPTTNEPWIDRLKRSKEDRSHARREIRWNEKNRPSDITSLNKQIAAARARSPAEGDELEKYYKSVYGDDLSHWGEIQFIRTAITRDSLNKTTTDIEGGLYSEVNGKSKDDAPDVAQLEYGSDFHGTDLPVEYYSPDEKTAEIHQVKGQKRNAADRRLYVRTDQSNLEAEADQHESTIRNAATFAEDLGRVEDKETRKPRVLSPATAEAEFWRDIALSGTEQARRLIGSKITTPSTRIGYNRMLASTPPALRIHLNREAGRPEDSPITLETFQTIAGRVDKGVLPVSGMEWDESLAPRPVGGPFALKPGAAPPPPPPPPPIPTPRAVELDDIAGANAFPGVRLPEDGGSVVRTAREVYGGEAGARRMGVDPDMPIRIGSVPRSSVGATEGEIDIRRTPPPVGRNDVATSVPEGGFEGEADQRRYAMPMERDDHTGMLVPVPRRRTEQRGIDDAITYQTNAQREQTQRRNSDEPPPREIPRPRSEEPAPAAEPRFANAITGEAAATAFGGASNTSAPRPVAPTAPTAAEIRSNVFSGQGPLGTPVPATRGSVSANESAAVRAGSAAALNNAARRSYDQAAQRLANAQFRGQRSAIESAQRDMERALRNIQINPDRLPVPSAITPGASGLTLSPEQIQLTQAFATRGARINAGEIPVPTGPAATLETDRMPVTGVSREDYAAMTPAERNAAVRSTISRPAAVDTNSSPEISGAAHGTTGFDGGSGGSEPPPPDHHDSHSGGHGISHDDGEDKGEDESESVSSLRPEGSQPNHVSNTSHVTNVTNVTNVHNQAPAKESSPEVQHTSGVSGDEIASLGRSLKSELQRGLADNFDILDYRQRKAMDEKLKKVKKKVEAGGKDDGDDKAEPPTPNGVYS